MIDVQPLPFFLAGTDCLARLRDLPWALLLDSGRPAATQGRYDLCMASPSLTLVSEGGSAVLRDAGARVLQTTTEPLRLLRKLLQERQVPPAGALPFCGGAAGYFGYDLGLADLAVRVRPLPLPEMAVGIYDWAVVSDHAEQRSWWVGRRAARSVLPMLMTRLQSEPPPAGGFGIEAGSLAMAPELDAYRTAFARVQDYLQRGDCYQVNLARRFRAGYRGDPWRAYCQLRALSPAPFGAYLSLPFAEILSISPERFLLLEQGRVETRPIKGTRPRRADPVADAAEAAALRDSDKDRAENVMIVDLMRNDLGRVCRPGSIAVPRLFDLEPHAGVWHLVSEVTGELRDDVGDGGLVRASFPPGSVTGAPKVRAMEIITEVEATAREVYTGAIGMVSAGAGADWNVAIRTFEHAGDAVWLGVGGGIVADSEPDAELAECRTKGAPLVAALGGSIEPMA